jgi:MoxR-like ATPase
MTTQHKFQTFRTECGAALIERSAEIDCALSALLAGEHPLFVGPPGTAKSMLMDALADWMHAPKYSILLTKFTTPEEVFGPVSISALKADRYERIIAGKLPTAELAFVDEVWKASSAIINTMLTVMNERKFHNGNGKPISCPLRMLVAASNEWPEGAEMGAMFDRFLVRKRVHPVRTAYGRDRLLWDETVGEIKLTGNITGAEIAAASVEAMALPFSDDAKQCFTEIIAKLHTEGVVPGDRRVKKSTKAARAYAWLNGNAEVESADLEILAHVLWDDPREQPEKCAEIVAKTANPVGSEINALLMEADEIIRNTNAREPAQAAAAVSKLQNVQKRMGGIKDKRADAAKKYLSDQLKAIKLAFVGGN